DFLPGSRSRRRPRLWGFPRARRTARGPSAVRGCTSACVMPPLLTWSDVRAGSVSDGHADTSQTIRGINSNTPDDFSIFLAAPASQRRTDTWNTNASDVMTAAPHMKTVFGQALDIEEPSDRLAFLDDACQGDAALRAGVEEMLRAHEEAGRFLDPDGLLP